MTKLQQQPHPGQATFTVRDGLVVGVTPTATTEMPLVMPLWPDAGRLLGLSRNGTYAAASAGSIPTLRFGRALRVPVAALNALLRSGHLRPRDPG